MIVHPTTGFQVASVHSIEELLATGTFLEFYEEVVCKSSFSARSMERAHNDSSFCFQ
jgi:hypothetical protein